MKKILLSLAVLALIAGCSKDKTSDNGGITPVVPEGIPTVATFNFNVDGATRTRTSSLPTDEAKDEKPFKEDGIIILIFDENGSQSLSTSNALQSLTTDGSKKITLETTSGAKRIFVFANAGPILRGRLAALKVGSSSLSNFYALMTNENKNKANRTVIDLGDDYREILAPYGAGDENQGYISMSNGASHESLYFLNADVTADQSSNATSDDDKKKYNNFVVVMKRMVAKARLRVDVNNSEPDKNSVNNTSNGDVKVFKTINSNRYFIGALFGDTKFGIRNVNRSIYYTQNFGDDMTRDNDLLQHTGSTGNTTNPTRLHAPYYELHQSIEDQTNANFDNYYYDMGVNISAPINAFGDDYNSSRSGYFPENSALKQVQGNTTHFAIEATIRRVPAKYIVKGVSLSTAVGQGDDVPLIQRFYNLVANDSGDDFVYDNSNAMNNTLYVQRREVTTGVTLSNSDGRVYETETVAFGMMFLLLEAAGLIGTPDNNKIAYNAGIWGTGTTTVENIWLPALRGPLDLNAPSGEKIDDATSRSALYFKDAAELGRVFNTPINGPGGQPTGEVEGFRNIKLQAISAMYASAFDAPLTEFFGIYQDAKCYYRLNINQKVSAGDLNLVRRNHAYNVTITGFKDLGDPSLDDLDAKPSEPVDQRTTQVTANISVQDWHTINLGGDI